MRTPRILTTIVLIFSFLRLNANPFSDRPISGTGLSADDLELRRATDHATNIYDASIRGFASSFSYADISLSASYDYGSLRRPQTAKDELAFRFDAAGARRLGRFALEGRFGLRQSYENGIGFASTFNPLRPTPYYIADSTGGDWTKQFYDLCALISFDVVPGKFTAGLGAEISVGRGAKRTDPRPQANTNNIIISPSISYNAKAGIFSASFIYSVFKETSNLILYDSSHPQKLYLMKGMGQYIYEIFSNTERERRYEGDDIGLNLSWLYRKDRFSFALTGKWTNGFETAFDMDYNKPHLRGKLYSDKVRVGAALAYGQKKIIHSIKLDYSTLAQSGREVVQVFDSSPEVNAWVTDSEIPGRYLRSDADLSFSYSLWLMRQGRISWKLNLAASKESLSESYAAMDSYMNIVNFPLSIGVAKFFYIKSGYFKAGFKAAGRLNHRGELNYVAREADGTIEDGLVLPDYEYLSSDIASGALSLTYALSLRDRKFLSFSASCAYSSSCGRSSSLVGPSSGDSSPSLLRPTRTAFSLRLGYNF